MAFERKNRRIAHLVAHVTTDGQIQSAGFDAVAVAASIPGISLDNYDSIGQLPTINIANGSLAFIGNTLYLGDSAGWFKMLSVNNTPVFNSITDDSNNVSPFTLSVDGNQTVITIDATDSEGFPLTYSVTADSAFNGMATYTQSSNVFTITPFSEDSATAVSGTLTFNISDGINTANSAPQSFSLDFLSEYWDNTVISLAANENNGRTNSGIYINDGTGPNGNTGLFYEAALLESNFFNPYSSSYSTYFDGSNDYYNATGLTAFGTDDFTVELWINVTANSSSHNIADARNGSNNSWTIQIAANELKIYDELQATYIHSTSGSWMSSNLNRWVHVAWVRSGTTSKFFIDGVQVGSDVTVSSNFNNTNINFGTRFTQDQQYYNGYISDFRMVKGNAVYSSTFSLPTKRLLPITGTQLLIFADNIVKDTSGNNVTLTRVSEPAVDSRAPYGSDEIRAQGYVAEQGYGSVFARSQSTKYGMSMGNASTAYHSFGSSFYVDFWLYTYPTSACNVVGYYTGTGLGTLIGYDGSQAFLSDGRVRATISRTDFFNYAPPRQWSHHHVQYSWDGYDFRFSWYINGVRRANSTGNFAPNNSVNITRWMIGSHNTSAEYNMRGNVADFTSANGNPYNHGTTGPTVPTLPKGDTTATFYMPFDNVGVYNKNNHYRFMSLAGNTRSSTAQTKYASASVYFDGNGDYIEMSADPAQSLGDQDFTVEFWVYHTAFGNPGRIFNIWDSSTTGAPGFAIYNSTDGKMRVLATSDGQWSSGSLISSPYYLIATNAITTNTWYHVAVCRDSGIIRLFVNGTLEDSNTISGSVQNCDSCAIGARRNGASYNENFTGYLENLQMIQGVAKYTSNFTPPTKEQGRTYQAIS